MPPFAICSNQQCPVRLDLHDEREGPSRLPPEKCHACDMPLIWYCPTCYWPIYEIPNRCEPRCSQCNRRLRFILVKESTSSDGDDKMPYALCSNSKCEYSVELHNRANGLPVETPMKCPRCKYPMISTCPECGFLLMGNCGATECAVCRADIRRVYMEWRACIQSALKPGFRLRRVPE